jgi:peptidoglycan/xylan/chitin deacetylase (PgdA/CDA1 family)
MFFLRLGHAIIRFSGIAFLIKKVIARKKATIIVYHNPTPQKFEEHLGYLSKRYNFISLSELSTALYSGNWKNIPDYAMVITFDDGWKENFNLLDIIIKYKIKPIIFLTSHIINTEKKFWWTECRSQDLSILKKISNGQRLLELQEKSDFHQEKEFPGDRQALNMPEIEKMKGFVEFGLHTCYHPVLTKCTKDEKRSEIIEGKVKVEELLEIPCETFSYPNGDYDDECIRILKETNIKIARSVDIGWNSYKTDPYKLKITGVSDDGSINKLASELTGIPMYFQYFSQGNFSGIKAKL